MYHDPHRSHRLPTLPPSPVPIPHIHARRPLAIIAHGHITKPFIIRGLDVMNTVIPSSVISYHAWAGYFITIMSPIYSTFPLLFSLLTCLSPWPHSCFQVIVSRFRFLRSCTNIRSVDLSLFDFLSLFHLLGAFFRNHTIPYVVSLKFVRSA